MGGTAGQIGIGLLGADFPADIRDLAYDFEHRSSIPKGQIALDALALLPVVGGLKYTDDAVAAAKHADKLMDTGGDLVYNGVKAGGKIDLKPAALMDELASSEKKYTPQDVIMVTKNSNGDLLWLETGNEKKGLTHILNQHKRDFKVNKDATTEIPIFLKSVLDTKSLKTGCNSVGPYTLYFYDEKYYLVAHGTNGFIESFYPVNQKHANKLLKQPE